MRVYGKLYRQENPRLLVGVRKADGRVGDDARHAVRQPRDRYDVAARAPDEEHLNWHLFAYGAQADYYRLVGHIDGGLVPIPDGILLAYGMLRERDDRSAGRDDSYTIPIRRLESYGRSVVTPCGRIVVSSELCCQSSNSGDEV